MHTEVLLSVLFWVFSLFLNFFQLKHVLDALTTSNFMFLSSSFFNLLDKTSFLIGVQNKMKQLPVNKWNAYVFALFILFFCYVILIS